MQAIFSAWPLRFALPGVCCTHAVSRGRRHAYTYAHIHVNIHAYIHIHACIVMCNVATHKYTYTCVQMYTCTCVHMHIIHIYIHLYRSRCEHIDACWHFHGGISYASRCTSFHCAPLLRCTSERRTLALMQCMPKVTQHLPGLPTSLSPTDFIT